MVNIANQTKRMQTSSFRDSRAGTGMKGDAKAVGVAALVVVQLMIMAAPAGRTTTVLIELVRTHQMQRDLS